MKKLLLIAIAALSAINVNAQSFNNQGGVSQPINSQAVSRSTNTAFSKISSSAKAYGVYHSVPICMATVAELNLTTFTNLGCVSNLKKNGNLGWITSSFSTDGGFAWDTTITPMHIGKSFTDTACRYPTGLIFNPVGNTIPNHAYTVVAGPYTNQFNWPGYYFGSSRLDGSFNNQQVFRLADTLTTTFKQSWPNAAATVAGNHVYILGIDQTISLNTVVPSGLFKGVVINKGTFDTASKSFSWTQHEIRIPIAIKPKYLLHLTSVDTIQDILSPFSSNMAWSAGGDIGYVCQFGVDSAQQAKAGTAGFFPIVYKTIDSGKTWNKLPYYAFNNNTQLTAHLIPAIGGTKMPFMGNVNGSRLMVDNIGRLHIITDVESAYSTNPDSLTQYITPQDPKTAVIPQYIYDLSTVDGTTWNSIFIDSIMSQPGTSLLWKSVNSPVIVGARIQASITADHSKVFVEWLDSDPSINGYNDYPDIYGKGIDYTNNNVTPVFNFTGGTSQHANCHWLYVSAQAFANAGSYSVPSTISLPKNNKYSADDTTYHYSVTGITFSDADFSQTGSGIAPVAKANDGVIVYPNPSSGVFTIKAQENQANGKLAIYNVIGDKIYQSVLTHSSVDIDISKHPAGIYFIVLESGQGISTGKVLVTK